MVDYLNGLIIVTAGEFLARINDVAVIDDIDHLLTHPTKT
jgi:hypothetical protein